MMKTFKYAALVSLSVVSALAGSLVVNNVGYGGVGNIYGNEYVSPYNATYTDSNGAIDLRVVCDDISASTYLAPTSYTVNMISFADLPSQLASTRWGNLTLYYAAAWISEQILSSSGTSPAELLEQGRRSFALWSLFIPSAPSWASAGLSSTEQTAINSIRTAALAAVTAPGFNAAQFASYSLVAPLANAPGSEPQEFLVRTPEPGVAAIWLFTVLSVAGIVMVLKRSIGIAPTLAS